jgi:hypothetical protein
MTGKTSGIGLPIGASYQPCPTKKNYVMVEKIVAGAQRKQGFSSKELPKRPNRVL